MVDLGGFLDYRVQGGLASLLQGIVDGFLLVLLLRWAHRLLFKQVSSILKFEFSLRGLDLLEHNCFWLYSDLLSYHHILLCKYLRFFYLQRDLFYLLRHFFAACSSCYLHYHWQLLEWDCDLFMSCLWLTYDLF